MNQARNEKDNLRHLPLFDYAGVFHCIVYEIETFLLCLKSITIL